MAYRLPGDRLALTLPDGPTVEVAPIGSWFVLQNAAGLTAAFFGATGPAAEMAALLDLYRFFVGEAQPSWEIVDHRGSIPPTADGMMRLPLPMTLALVDAWTATFPEAPAAEPGTAVDAVIPPGPLRDELNAELRAKRAKVS